MGYILFRHSAAVVLNGAVTCPVCLLQNNDDLPIRCSVLTGVFQQVLNANCNNKLDTPW